MDNGSMWGIVGSEDPIQNDVDDLIRMYLDKIDGPLPSTIKIQEFEPMVPTHHDFPYVLSNLLEMLDEIYADPDGMSETLPTTTMLEAERDFIDAVIKEYWVWACEPVSGTQEDVDVRTWVEENEPDWSGSVTYDKGDE